MVDSRAIDLRISLNINPNQLSMPFMYIQAKYGFSVESILRKLHVQSILHLGEYPDTFPNTIAHYYWIKYVSNTDSMNWIAIGKLNSGLYFLYTAHCKNMPRAFAQPLVDGVPQGGQMNLWASMRFSDIIHFAMSQDQYEQYLNETVVIVPIAAVANIETIV